MADLETLFLTHFAVRWGSDMPFPGGKREE
jgi:hypothetical protein